MHFAKMHGTGNDFVLIEAKGDEHDWPRLAAAMCDRHFGVGADGILLVLPSDRAAVRMRVLNPDGSEPEMCGNGIRCFARYVYETDNLSEEVISVETLAGVILPAVILDQKKKVAGVEVDMGIPKDLGEVSLHSYNFKKISMGNPHAVAFVEDLAQINLYEIGPKIENDKHFPHRTNVEFVKVLNENEIEVAVWERGAGETLACGTGASASVAVGNILGKLGKRVLVHLPGGNLDIELIENNHLLMRGPAERVFEGKYYL